MKVMCEGCDFTFEPDCSDVTVRSVFDRHRAHSPDCDAVNEALVGSNVTPVLTIPLPRLAAA